MADNEVVSPLSNDEMALLGIMAEGQPVADIGERSRWHGPLNSLLRRGFIAGPDKFNYGLTPAGRAAFEAAEQADDRALEEIVRKRGSAYEGAPRGPSVTNGHLVYRLRDGTLIACHCIADPYASMIVKDWNER